MKFNPRLIGMILALLLSALPPQVAAEPIGIDWEVTGQIGLESQPLDVEIDLEGEITFVLLPGKVAVFNRSFDRLLNQIPVDQSFDQLAYAHESNTLILTSSASNKLRTIRIDRIYEISIENSPFLGPENAPVTIAVFDDYECPYCAKMENVFSQLLAKYPQELKLVIKHFPLRKHQNARQAALAVLAANKQGKFWEFHSQVFANHADLSVDKLDEIAESFELDMDQFRKDIMSKDVIALIVRDVREGRRIGVSGTPTVFINGKMVEDANLNRLDKLIQKELDR